MRADTGIVQVTAMPYFDCVKVNISPITVQMHEVWLRHMLQFEIDAVGDIADAKAAELEVNEDVKYIRRAQIGQPKDSEETLETLSFLGKGISLRQQFFQELDLCGFTAQVTLSGLSAVPLRNAIQAQVGPVSKMYGFIHDLGQKVSIPEINGAPVALNLPNHHDLCNRESAWRKTQTQNSWRDNDEADRLFKLRQGYLGFVKTGADGMLNQGLFALFDAVVLVCRKDMMVQEDIPMSAITDVSLTEDSMMIKSGVRSTALELRVQEGHAKCAKMRQVILQQVELAKQKERMIASADQGEAM